MMSIEKVDQAISRLSKTASIRSRLYALRNKAIEHQDYLPCGAMDSVLRYIDEKIDATIWGQK